MTIAEQSDEGGAKQGAGGAVSDEMIDAGQLAWLNAGGHDCDSADLVGPIYLAMRAAEKPSPVETVDEDAEWLRGLVSTLRSEYDDDTYLLGTSDRLEALAARLSAKDTAKER